VFEPSRSASREIRIVAPQVARACHRTCCRTVAVARPDTTGSAIRCNTQQGRERKPL